jgi:hypothetical protein
MTDRRTEEQLDAVLDALGARPAQLDEVAQARVRARLEAAIIEVDLAAVRSVGRWRRVGVAGGVGLAAAAAVIAVVVAARTGGPATSKTAAVNPPAPAGRAAPVTDRAASAGPTALPAPAPAGPAIATAGPADPGRTAGASAAQPASPPATRTAVTVAAGESIQLALAGAAVTLYGPGQLSPTPDGAVVDAAGLMVDRPHGDAPWSVRYRGTEIVVAHATFTIGGSSQTRVSVIRGEVELHCPSGLQTIRSGGSGACELVPVVRATPHRSPRAASRPAPPEEAETRVAEPVAPPPPPAAPPTPGELYAAAESALGRGDLDAAQDALLAVVDAAPDSLDAAIALVDLARLVAKRGDTSRALDYLARLDRHPRRAWVAAPADLLLKSLARGDSNRALNPP